MSAHDQMTDRSGYKKRKAERVLAKKMAAAPKEMAKPVKKPPAKKKASGKKA